MRPVLTTLALLALPIPAFAQTCMVNNNMMFCSDGTMSFNYGQPFMPGGNFMTYNFSQPFAQPFVPFMNFPGFMNYNFAQAFGQPMGQPLVQPLVQPFVPMPSPVASAPATTMPNNGKFMFFNNTSQMPMTGNNGFVTYQSQTFGPDGSNTRWVTNEMTNPDGSRTRRTESRTTLADGTSKQSVETHILFPDGRICKQNSNQTGCE